MDKVRYRECEQGRRFVLTFAPGAKIVEELRRFAARLDVKVAAIVSAVGSIRDLVFHDIQIGAHLPLTQPRVRQHTAEGPLLLLGMQGNLVAGEGGKMTSHLHAMAAKSSGEVIGGDLVEAEVFAVCEIVISEYLVEGIARQRFDEIGTDTLDFQEK